MKLTWIAMLLIVANAQSAFAECSGTIYHFSKGKSRGQAVLKLNSFESIAFRTENAECISSLKNYQSREICVELKNVNGRIVADVERKQSADIQYADSVLLDLQQGRYDSGTQLNTYLGNDLRSGRYSLATVVDVNNKEQDVIALGLNCR